MSWMNAVKAVGKWYEANIHEYNQGRWAVCPIPNVGNCRWDCSGYVSACLRAANVFQPGETFSSAEFMSGRAKTKLEQAGWTRLAYSLNMLQEGDILVKNGHVEIFAGVINGSHHSWAWGSCHDGLNGRKGMPAYMAYKNKGGYTYVYRCGASAADIAASDNLFTSYIAQFSVAGAGAIANIKSVASTDGSPISQSVFSDAMSNTSSLTLNTSVGGSSQHTRIYSALNPTILVDELSLPLT